MTPYDYIKQRQVLWALRYKKRLGGQFRHDPDTKKAERGEKLFTFDLVDNLFEPLSQEAVHEFENGDGGELNGRMNAVHSSSAVAVNVFHYWRSRRLWDPVAKALNVPSREIKGMRFEAKFSIHDEFQRSPNLDVVIDCAPRNVLRATAIECKFDEPYGGRKKKGLNPVYLEHDEFWTDLPNLRELADQLPPENTRFGFLDAPQLVKHVLGLKRAYGKRGFRLVYLWYNVPGTEAVRHAAEVAEFSEFLGRDEIAFQTLTYQEVILNLTRSQREKHTAFIDYLVERYL